MRGGAVVWTWKSCWRLVPCVWTLGGGATSASPPYVSVWKVTGGAAGVGLIPRASDLLCPSVLWLACHYFENEERNVEYIFFTIKLWDCNWIEFICKLYGFSHLVPESSVVVFLLNIKPQTSQYKQNWHMINVDILSSGGKPFCE